MRRTLSYAAISLPLRRQGKDEAQRSIRIFYEVVKFDGLVKSRKSTTNVIPAKAGIQKYQMVTKALDPGFRRGDDFLRVRQFRVL
jgi:hypothetical protein